MTTTEIVDDVSIGKYGTYQITQCKRNNDIKFSEINMITSALEDRSLWIRGRVHTVRRIGKMCFLILRQQQFTVQAVLLITDGTSVQMIKFVSNVANESIVDVFGIVRKVETPIIFCTQQNAELHVTMFYIVSIAQHLPLQIKDISRPVSEDDRSKSYVNLHIRLDNRVLDLRTSKNHAIFKIQSGICNIFRNILVKQNFTEIYTPKIVSAGSSAFTISYFKEYAYLTRSAQFYNQMAICADFGRVFSMGSVFRAEYARTNRHLTEFISLDIEMEFQFHYHEALETLSCMMIKVFQRLQREYKQEIETIRKYYPVETLEFMEQPLILHYKEAVKLLNENGVSMRDFDDLCVLNEKLLGKLVKDKYHVNFYVVDKFPLCTRPFYTMPDPDNDRYSNSYVMYVRGEEVLSGGQRIHDRYKLVEHAARYKIDLKTIENYINSFSYGCSPHAGAGIGIERFTMLFLGLGNIRLASMFPRDCERMMP